MSRQEYLEATVPLIKGSYNFFTEDRLLEWRNCVCGSTLIIETDDRRDKTDFGAARRKFFDTCIVKITEATKEDIKEVRKDLRILFNEVIDNIIKEAKAPKK